MSKHCVICNRILCKADKEFCSEECHQKHCKNFLQYNLKGVLGLGFCWQKNKDSFELLEVQYKYKNIETEKVETIKINFEE